MPAKSAKQYKLAAGIAHGSISATGGMNKNVAKEMVDATPSRMRSNYMKTKKKK